MRGLQIILTIIAIIYFVWTIPTKADPKEVNVDLKTDIAELCSEFKSDIKNSTTISRPLKTNSIIIYHGNCLKLLPRKSLLKKSRIPHTHLSERSSELPVSAIEIPSRSRLNHSSIANCPISLICTSFFRPSRATGDSNSNAQEWLCPLLFKQVQKDWVCSLTYTTQ